MNRIHRMAEITEKFMEIIIRDGEIRDAEEDGVTGEGEEAGIIIMTQIMTGMHPTGTGRQIILIIFVKFGNSLEFCVFQF